MLKSISEKPGSQEDEYLTDACYKKCEYELPSITIMFSSLKVMSSFIPTHPHVVPKLYGCMAFFGGKQIFI